MQANKIFKNYNKSFWAIIRSVSQEIGYTKKGNVSVPTTNEIINAFRNLNLDEKTIYTDGAETKLCVDIMSYYQYRADILNNFVEPRLMDVEKAEKEFNRLYSELKFNCPIPMNKQKGDKKAPAFFTGIINMILSDNLKNIPCDFDPRKLTTITKNGIPLRTLSRRVDGAFPTIINPHAIWEIKEYYYTTTFGSRIADGVYESLLDGMELEELQTKENIKIQHLFMIDSHRTWWMMGKSYLCRIIDMINMGYIDEVLFGYEVIEKLPEIAKKWAELSKTFVNSD